MRAATTAMNGSTATPESVVHRRVKSAGSGAGGVVPLSSASRCSSKVFWSTLMLTTGSGVLALAGTAMAALKIAHIASARRWVRVRSRSVGLMLSPWTAVSSSHSRRNSASSNRRKISTIAAPRSEPDCIDRWNVSSMIDVVTLRPLWAASCPLCAPSASARCSQSWATSRNCSNGSVLAALINVSADSPVNWSPQRGFARSLASSRTAAIAIAPASRSSAISGRSRSNRTVRLRCVHSVFDQLIVAAAYEPNAAMPVEPDHAGPIGEIQQCRLARLAPPHQISRRHATRSRSRRPTPVDPRRRAMRQHRRAGPEGPGTPHRSPP